MQELQPIRTVNKGLCQACVPLVLWDIEQRIKLIRDSEKAIEKSPGLGIQLSKCDLIIENAERLLAYEQRGLDVKSQPSEIISEYRARRDALALSGLEHEIEFALSKSGVTGSAKSRVLSPHASRSIRAGEDTLNVKCFCEQGGLPNDKNC